ncbi:DEAD/DEAH box helicase family protein [Nonomuraea endophytica]|uniref:DEAD/DEAH box helicase family protein n=1 Tax=Nonomuraea endophytica TaxID=714136 RepID=UPI0037CA12F1
MESKFGQQGAAALDAERLDALRDLPFSELLRPHQQQAIAATENALVSGRTSPSIVMAAGSGKTVTIMAMIHRLLRSGVAQRVLYLTNRRIMAQQAFHSLRYLEVESGLTLSSIVPVYQGVSAHRVASDENRPFLCVGTIQALATLVRTKAAEDQDHGNIPDHRFDVAVCDDFGAESTAWRRAIDHFCAAKIEVVSTDRKSIQGSVVYRYDLQSAINDNVLVAHNSARIRPNVEDVPTSAALKNIFAGRRVFLASSAGDSSFAHNLSSILRERGLKPVLIKEEWPGVHQSVSGLLEELRGGDILTVLLSPRSAQSVWAMPEIHAMLERRGVEIIPAVFRPCFIPKALADRTVVDLVSGPDNLLRALYVAAEIDLGSLSAHEFERLVADLLRRLHFDLFEPETGDSGIDFQSTYYDPMGFGEPTRYVIQVKAQGHRASVDGIYRLAGAVRNQPRRTSALLVTSGQLTSVASGALEQLNDKGASIHVMDGPRFKNHLLAFPDLIRSYFTISRSAL